ncbi:hypothetical protein Hanom_Chr07g00644791 [Helianthus anomalus]
MSATCNKKSVCFFQSLLPNPFLKTNSIITPTTTFQQINKQTPLPYDISYQNLQNLKNSEHNTISKVQLNREIIKNNTISKVQLQEKSGLTKANCRTFVAATE